MSIAGDASASMIGKTFGKYRIVEQLGSGGMAVLYKAFQMNLERYVALKLMHTHLSTTPEFVERFEGEAKSIAMLRHPNIVQVYDYDIEGNISYIVMELIEGKSLDAILQKANSHSERLPLQMSLQIGREIAQALAYAHQANVIHRDIKPGNIMISQDGRAILTDFGLAKIQTHPSHTIQGTALGTPSYMAPEQGMGEPGNPLADLYSLGIVLFEMVTGRLPFEASNPMALIIKHIQETAPRASQFNSNIPEILDNIIERCLAKNPEDRYSSAEELVRALQFVSESITPAAGIPVLASQSSPQLGIATQAPSLVVDIKPPPEPTLPPITREFVGRQQEIEDCLNQLRQDHLVVISGMPGVGKTALAAALAQRLCDPAHTFWHTFHAGEGVDSLIWKLAGYFSWRGQQDLWLILQNAQNRGSEPPPSEVLFDYVFQMLRGRNDLLCFDNFHFVAEDPLFEQFGNRLQALAVEGNLSVIIVTARHLPGVIDDTNYKPLAGFTREDTLSLLRSRGLSIKEDLVEDLYKSTEGFAQLLILAMDALKHGKDPSRLIRQLPEIEQVEQYLIKSVDDGLTPEERKLMCAVAILCGYPGSRNALAAILDVGNLRRMINELTSRYLLSALDGEDGKEYSQHKLVQSFYYDLLSRSERQEMHRRAAEHYAQRDYYDPLKAAFHYQRSGDDPEAIRLVCQDMWRIINRGQVRIFLDVLDNFSPTRINAYQDAMLQLVRGQVFAFLGQRASAEACYNGVFRILADLAESSYTRDLQARLCLGMGELWQEENPQTALDWLKQGLNYLSSNKSHLWAALNIRAGRVYAYLGEVETAVEKLKMGLSALPEEPSRLHITALGNLGNIYCMQGDIECGRDYYQQVLHMAEQIGDYWSIVEVQLNLGIELDINGQLRDAVHYFEEALQQAKRLGSLAQQVRARSLLGIVFTKLGQYEEAHTSFAQCIQMAKQADLKSDLIYVLPSLADLCLRQGNIDQAIQRMGEADQLIQSTSAGKAEALPEMERMWALVYLKQNQAARALEHAQQALVLARESGSDTEEGIALRVKGQVLQACGQTDEAHVSYEQSLEILKGRDPYEAAQTQSFWGELMLQGDKHLQGVDLLNQALMAFQKLGSVYDQAVVLTKLPKMSE